MALTFELKHYEQLSKDEFFEIAKLRIDVFIVEQHCPYPDLDDTDKQCFHFMMKKDGELAGYVRLIDTEDPKLKKLGRIIIAPPFREDRLGKTLVQQALKATQEQYPQAQKVAISAQQIIIPFYNKVGFKEEGPIYLEDRIPHRKMVYTF